METTNVPSYSIDLTKAESVRWEEVIARERSVAGQLVAEAAAELQRVPEIFRWVFAQLYRASGGLYRGEIEAWAEALGVSPGTVTMLNCAYELSHVRRPKLLGCTAGVRWIDGLGMVHLRNLDWPLRGLGEATRLFTFHRRHRQFVTVGVPGQVGVLSGMLPHAYSVTINWAPPAARLPARVPVRAGVPPARCAGNLQSLRRCGQAPEAYPTLDECVLHRLRHRKGTGLRDRADAE